MIDRIVQNVPENIKHEKVNGMIEIRCDYDQMNYEGPCRGINYEKF